LLLSGRSRCHFLLARCIRAGSPRLRLKVFDANLNPSRRTVSVSSASTCQALRGPTQPTPAPVSEPAPDNTCLNDRHVWHWDGSFEHGGRFLGDANSGTSVVSLQRIDSPPCRTDGCSTSFQQSPSTISNPVINESRSRGPIPL
jgi:hypothetical protein